MPSIKTAIVGWGLSGASFHAPILAALPDFEIAAVVSRRPDAVHASLPGVAVFPDIETLLSQTDVALCVDGAIRAAPIASERGAYEQFYLGLAQAIPTGAAIPVDAIAGTRVVHVLEAAEISHAEGRVAPFVDPALGATS